MESNELQHHYIANTALPYAPNSSATSKEPAFIDNSTNLLTSIKGYAERRNGFAYYESSTTFTFSGNLVRFYTWRRWTGAAVTLSGSYFVMFNDIGTTSSRVWKQRVGVDALPVLIHTDPTSTNPFDFVVSNNFLFFGDGVDMVKYDGTTTSNWGITAPSAAVSVIASSTGGTLSPTIGYKWVIAWNNSSTTHVSSPSTPSTDTGALSNQQFILTGNTTTDTQVDKVRVFRTIDGGSIYFEHPSSPVNYATWIASGLTDNSADSLLSSAVAPLPNQNNRPTPSNGPVWFANRIWTFFNDTLYYSGFEELVRGVEEESFATINYRFFGREITGLAVAGQFLLIFTADTIYRIFGDSSATFGLDTLAHGKGALNRAAIVAVDKLVAWLDSSNTVWVTDGANIPDKDLSYPIRSDIQSIVHSTAAMAYHKTGNARWIMLMDGTGGKLYVFDMDLQQWMPPWPIEAITALYSGQTAPATSQLFLGRNKVPLVQDTNYQDQGVPYTAGFYTNLFDLVPQGNPSEYGVADHIELETNAVLAATVKYLTDEDPSTGTYQTATQVNDPPNRTQGVNLVEKWYSILSDPNNRGARRMALNVNWAATNTNLNLFGCALAFKPVDE